MTRPTTEHSARYRDALADGRLHSPTFERNAGPVIDGLAPYLAGLSGHALEIGSGPGRHVCAFARAFPGLAWTPSDPDPVHRKSIAAWAAHEAAPVAAPLDLDAAGDWAARGDVAALAPLRLVIAMNVIHIAPFAVAEGLVAGAGRALAPGGYLAFYGPFRENGAHTGDGNRIFDARLRADNADWGLRDTAEITGAARTAGLETTALLAMPANNRILLFRKS